MFAEAKLVSTHEMVWSMPQSLFIMNRAMDADKAMDKNQGKIAMRQTSLLLDQNVFFPAVKVILRKQVRIVTENRDIWEDIEDRTSIR